MTSFRSTLFTVVVLVLVLSVAAAVTTTVSAKSDCSVSAPWGSIDMSRVPPSELFQRMGETEEKMQTFSFAFFWCAPAPYTPMGLPLNNSCGGSAETKAYSFRYGMEPGPHACKNYYTKAPTMKWVKDHIEVTYLQREPFPRSGTQLTLSIYCQAGTPYVQAPTPFKSYPASFHRIYDEEFGNVTSSIACQPSK